MKWSHVAVPRLSPVRHFREHTFWLERNAYPNIITELSYGSYRVHIHMYIVYRGTLVNYFF